MFFWFLKSKTFEAFFDKIMLNKTYLAKWLSTRLGNSHVKNYKNHSMIKIYKISCYFSACFCRGLLGKFLLQQDETKLSNDFYTCKKTLRREKNIILIQKPKNTRNHIYTVAKFVWCFRKIKQKGNVVSKLFTRNERLVKQN